jgi:hypothetical protein
VGAHGTRLRAEGSQEPGGAPIHCPVGIGTQGRCPKPRTTAKSLVGSGHSLVGDMDQLDPRDWMPPRPEPSIWRQLQRTGRELGYVPNRRHVRATWYLEVRVVPKPYRRLIELIRRSDKRP